MLDVDDPVKNGKPIHNKALPSGAIMPVENDNDDNVGNDVLVDILNELKGLRCEVSTMNARLTRLEDYFKSVDTRVEKLEQDNKALRKDLLTKDGEISKLKYQFDSIEQDKIHLDLIASGPEIASLCEATFKDDALGVIKTKLQLSDDFLARFSVKRVGAEGKLRARLAAQNKDDFTEMFKTVKTAKPEDFYLSESLTKYRQDIFYKIRKFRKDNNLQFSAYSYRGDLYVKLDPNGNSHKVFSLSDVQKLCAIGNVN